MSELLEVGTTAPDFETTDHTGKAFKLSEHQGQPIVIFFYPKASTPG